MQPMIAAEPHASLHQLVGQQALCWPRGIRLDVQAESESCGARCYVAVSGGINTPVYLGSRATFPGGKLGGVQVTPPPPSEASNMPGRPGADAYIKSYHCVLQCGCRLPLSHTMPPQIWHHVECILPAYQIWKPVLTDVIAS